MKDLAIDVGGGRQLACTDIGEPGWPCVLFFHGAPSSRLRLAYLEQQFVDARVRAVSPDRPGYGRSSPQPGRSMRDWPCDVSALVDTLAIERFMVAGHSSGGPYAVACAALLQDRVTACVTLGGVTDMAWPAAWEGFPESEKHLMRIPNEKNAVAWCAERFGADGSRFFAASGLSLPEPDTRLYDDEAVARLLTVSRAAAFEQGVAGYAQDVLVQGRPWPFDPGTIKVPVYALHGASDTILPVAHSRHTSDLIPRSTLRVLPGHGHFTILSEIPAVVLESTFAL
jgi:pimeloyl-ACP methyl ester carboxylesterase